MATKKLEYSDIAEPKVLEPLIKDFGRLDKQIKSTIELLELLKKQNSKIASETTFEKSQKDLEKFIKAMEDLNDETKQQQKLIVQRTKLEQQLANATGENAVETEKLKIQIREARKETKRIADEAINGTNAYKTLSAETNKAQANFKKLAAQFGINSKEAKQARKEFEKLHDELSDIDKQARDGRRNVGRYAESFQELGDTIKNLDKILVASAIFGFINAIGSIFTSSDTGAKALQKTIGTVTISISVFLNRIIKALPIAGDLFASFFVTVSNGLKEFANTFIDGFNAIIGGINNLSDYIGTSAIPAIEKFETVTNNYTATVSDLTDAFSELTDEIGNKIEANNKAIDLEFKNIKLTAEYNRLIAEQSQLLEKQTAIMDDDRRGLLERKEAAKQAIDIQKEVNRLSIEQAELEVKLAKARKDASTDSVQAQADYDEAVANSIEVKKTANEQENALRRELNTLNNDILQIQLDFLIDATENENKQRQKGIENEKKSFAERRKLAEENRKALLKSFVEEQKVINKEQEDLKKQTIDFQKILSGELDSQGIIDYLLSLEVSEATMIRVLEVIKNTKDATQDYDDTLKNLNENQKESNRINKDIELQEQALIELRKEGADTDKILSNLEKQRSQERINQIDNELLELQKNKKKEEDEIKREVELIQEKNEILLKSEIDRLKKTAQEEKTADKERIERTKETLDAIEKLSDNFFKKRISQIEEDISKEEERESRLIRLAEEGNALAEENLAQSQKRQAELERQRQIEIKRQKQAEIALAAAKTYVSKVEQGEPQPLTSTVTDIALLQTFIGGLAGFYEGTDKVSDDMQGTKFSSGKDGYLARVDGQEMIFNPTQSKIIRNAGLTRNDIVQSVQEQMAYKKVKESNPNFGIEKKLDSLEKTVREKAVYLGDDWDAKTKALTSKIKQGNKLTKKIRTNVGF